ncbi:DNA-dependent protein kinase catalytic subunit-like isoform X2 [Acanthaster planci]|uniref:DNA-dependent protein kinase catalytic subunit-like isoform X2 n=1 Tax=Acanthaster planci TaxID=133434 RepID=A0A8B8A1Z1_ACAPL|nr:DNA-dependent protein kinase catalytic subunit-like isoform X2 [Acanthaster planci]
MATADLPVKLSELNGLISTKSGLHVAEKAQDLVVDLGHLCLRQLSENELAYCCSQLFNKDNGILVFLNKAIPKDELKGSKEQLLEFLHAFLLKAGSRLLARTVEIKKICISAFMRDKSAKVKTKTFPVLIELLQRSASAQMEADLDIPKMIELYFEQLMQPSKLSQTVKQGIYCLLGVLAEIYPVLMSGYSERLLSVYIATLNQQMTSKTRKPELTVIAGCLTGLGHYLVNFTQSVEEGAKHSKDIYRFARMAIDPTVDHTRYELNKAGLNMFAKHSAQFGPYLYSDHQDLHEAFNKWSAHNNPAVKAVGFAAQEAFLQQIAEILVERAAKRDASDMAVFRFFVKRFRDIIDNPQSDTRALSSAVRGYGYFAAPCKLFMTDDDVKFMFTEMIQRSEQLYLQQGEVSDDKLNQLPNFLEALASIMRQLDVLSDSFQAALERLVVVQVSSYPRVPNKYQYLSHQAILLVLIALSSKGATLKNFLSRVVYQALVQTCSHPVVLDGSPSIDHPVLGNDDQDTEADILADARHITYKDYVKLWASLLDSTHVKEVQAMGMNYADRRKIHIILYDELIFSILKILSKLDLTSNKDTTELQDQVAVDSDSTEDASSDPLHGLHATKPKDFQIFVNLVDFCRDLLPANQPALFKQWVYRFGHEVILLSCRLPLVSGFYKLLTVCMNICTQIQFFKCIKPSDLSSQEDSMDIDLNFSSSSSCVSASDRCICFTLFAKFSKEVLVRLKQYKDDLLASCLLLVLSLPHEIVQAEVAHLVPALQMTFQLGLSYLPLAETGLEALERWMLHLLPDSLQPHLKVILPLLDGYLRGTITQGSDAADVVQTVTMASASSSGRAGKRKLPAKLIKGASTTGQTQDSPLRSVQLRILHLLGSLGGQTNAYLLETSAEEIAKVAVAWDTQPRLQFAVPFVDMKPNIDLDRYLPRVVELALTSGDRQTKVAACESLHTLVLFMLGKGTQQPEQRQAKSPMQHLYRRVFPALFRLSCDVEQVARQLFEPLVMQLIHWFTGNKKFESEETTALLNAMLDGVIHPTDTSLRDFSACCLKEFLKWSIKQTSKKQQEKSPINTKSLLKRLYSMALHPSSFKRLGAALTFNHIYTVFREEDSLIDQFVCEILVTFVNSLALAHHDDKSLGTQLHGVEVLNHLERIIRVKADMLNKESKIRRIPREFPAGVCPTLSMLVIWLLRQCGRAQTECRHQCMILIYKITPLLPGHNTPQTWMQNTLKEKGPDYFVSRFEGGGVKAASRSGISKYPTLSTMGQPFSVKLACSWFDHLLAALDCYTWVFGEKLLSPSVVYTATARRPSVLFQSLQYFLSSLSLLDITGAARGIEYGGSKTSAFHQVFTPRESEEYNQEKCTVIVRLWDFLTVLLENYASDAVKVIPKSIWQDSLFDLVVTCILQPTVVGFNMADVEIMNNLPKTTRKLLRLMSTHLPANLRNNLSKAVTRSVTKSSHHDLTKLLQSMFGRDEGLTTDHGKLIHLVKGYEQLHQANLLSAATTGHGSGSSFAVKLFITVFDSLTTSDEAGKLLQANLTPLSVELAESLLDLAFLLGIEAKMLVSCLLDKTALFSGRSSTSKGAVFYTTFKTKLNGEMAVQAQKVIPLLVREGGKDVTVVSSVLNGLLDYLTSSREVRRTHGMSVHSAILTQWDILMGGLKKGCSTDLQSFALLMLRKLLQIDAKFVSDTTHPVFSSVLEAYSFMLTDASTSLTFKAQVMDVLFFFTSLPDGEQTKLRSALDRLVADNFPLNSSEFRVGSPKYIDYAGALNKILTAMVLSGNLMLLEIVISIMCRDEKHAYEDEIQESLAAFIKRLPEEKQTAAFGVAYQIFCQENSFSKEIRRAAIERVCIPLMRLAGVKALSSFFKECIKNIGGIIDAKTIKAPETVFQNQLVSKTCCFQLVELMYSRLVKEDLFSMDSAINKAYTNDVKTGKEMTQALTKACHAAKSEDIRGETNALELRRQFHCAAFNALIAIISCTQTDIKFYNAFLFSENTAKGQFLLDNIIDITKNYSFEIEMNAPMERKKRFVSIRNQIQDTVAGSSSQQSDSGIEMSGYTGRYLSTQYLANSSLSEDIQQFDFSGGVQQFNASIDKDQSLSQRSSVPHIKKRYSNEETPTVVVQGEYIEMESDALNQHECMASLTAVLKHMQANKITPEIPEASEMPGWMASLQKKLTSQSTHVNIKLFIARLIINNNEVFTPYARFWLSGLLQLLISGNTGGEGIHYMVVDVVVVLLGWVTVAIPEDKRLANRLLEFLMHFCHHSNRQVLRNNLEMIKTLVECWKEIISVPTSVIYRILATPDPDVKDSSTGLQLLGIVLANGLHPIDKASDIDEERFYAALSYNLKNRYKMVHAAAAEVIGMAMKQKADVDKVTDGFLHSIVTSELTKISEIKPDVFVTCIHKLHFHYPEFADHFTNKLLFMLPSLHGQPKTLCLEVVASRVSHIPNIFLEMKSKGIVELLTHRDEGTQLVSLKLVNAMLPNLKPDEILYLLPPVRTVFNLPSPACREVMYDILMWIYDNFSNRSRDEESRTEDGADDILCMAKDTLLQGLSDEEASHRLRVSNFWSHETRLPTGTLERLVAMLECMYSPGTEHQYLSYASSLLLEMTSKSPDYKREIFEHPLSECRFQDVTIDHSWKQRHLAISTPMFVETQSSQASSGSQSQSPPDSSLSRGEIRATQDAHQFIATQQLDAVASRKNAYNWLTGSQDTFADYSTSSASDQSSLLFTLGASKKMGRGRQGVSKTATDAGFGKEKLQSDQPRGRDEVDAKQSGEDKKINRLKRRFLKDHSSSQAYFARREMKRKQLKEKILEEQRERKFSTVTMYRRYRTGDLPDIQIKYSDLIAPLQALAQRDASLARLLFSSLFRGIFSEIEEVKTEREAESTKVEINRHLNTMLSTSTQYFPPFISCVQEISYYHSEQLTLVPSTISTASLTSQQMHIGIRLLEENLIQKPWQEEKSAKRARFVSREPSPEISTWIELARLYKALGDFDAVQGVFSACIGTHEITKTALEAEARGDYSTALKLYNQAFEMDWDEGAVSQVEEDLWDESRLNCCNQLTQWKELQNYSTVNIDDNSPHDLGKIWSDTFYQELYLPHMMRSMLKQLMEGGEDETLLQFIDASMSDADKRAFLEARYSEELSTLYTIQEDYDRAMFYLANCRQSFLHDWSGLGPLMISSRRAKLQCIQRLTEKQNFLKLAIKPDLQEAIGCQKSLELLDRWSGCHLDSKKDPINIWDDVVSNRLLYMDKLGSRFIRSESQQAGEEETALEKRILRERLWLELKMADSACQQGNFSVAQKHLKATHGSLSAHEDLKPKWTHSYVQMNQQKILTIELKEQVMTLLTTFDPLAKLSNTPALTGDYCLTRHHHTLTSKSYDLVAIAIQKGGADILTGLRNVGKLDKLLGLVGQNATRPEQICSTLYSKAYSELKQAVSLADKDDAVTSQSERSMTEAYMALVSFCDRMLRLKESDEVPMTYLPQTDNFSQTVVHYTLKAMHYSSQEARQRFPRLLQLVEACPDTMQLMIKEVQ